LIEIINKQLLLQLVGYLCYWQMGFNSVFKGLKGVAGIIGRKHNTTNHSKPEPKQPSLLGLLQWNISKFHISCAGAILLL